MNLHDLPPLAQALTFPAATPRCGDIGDNPREVEYEPLTAPSVPEPVRTPAPAPAAPEPVKEPAHV